MLECPVSLVAGPRTSIFDHLLKGSKSFNFLIKDVIIFHSYVLCHWDERWSFAKSRVAGLVNFKAFANSKGVQHGSNKMNGVAKRSREWTRAALSWKSQWIKLQCWGLGNPFWLSPLMIAIIPPSWLRGSNTKGVTKRCRSPDNVSTEFLKCSISPSRVLNMKYKIVWASCLLVSIPKRFVSIIFWHSSLIRLGLDIHCRLWFRSANNGYFHYRL